MLDYSPDNLFIDYHALSRHWHAASEAYAGGDCLVTALQRGWEMDDVVHQEEFWHAGSRLVMIYHFTLMREGETVNMPVISNPYIHRLLRMQNFDVEPIADQKHS